MAETNDGPVRTNTKGAILLDDVLTAAGYENTGGGNNFTSWSRDNPDREFYVFGSVAGSGPDDCHWVEIDPNNNDEFLAGGFTADSLRARLATDELSRLTDPKRLAVAWVATIRRYVAEMADETTPAPTFNRHDVLERVGAWLGDIEARVEKLAKTLPEA